MQLEVTEAVQQADRNRLDRVPTRGERWIGVILSAVLALLFLPAALFMVLKTPEGHEDRVGLAIFASVLALVGVAGAFFFYRIAFTKPKAASIRAHGIYVKVSVVVASLLVVVSLVHPVSAAQTATSFALLFVALAALAGTRKGKDRAKRK